MTAYDATVLVKVKFTVKAADPDDACVEVTTALDWLFGNDPDMSYSIEDIETIPDGPEE